MNERESYLCAGIIHTASAAAAATLITETIGWIMAKEFSDCADVGRYPGKKQGWKWWS